MPSSTMTYIFNYYLKNNRHATVSIILTPSHVRSFSRIISLPLELYLTLMLYPALHWHLNPSSRSIHASFVWLQSLCPLRHSFSGGQARNDHRGGAVVRFFNQSALTPTQHTTNQQCLLHNQSAFSLAQHTQTISIVSCTTHNQSASSLTQHTTNQHCLLVIRQTCAIH